MPPGRVEFVAETRNVVVNVPGGSAIAKQFGLRELCHVARSVTIRGLWS